MEAILLYVSIIAFTYLGYLFWSSRSLEVSDIAYRIVLLILALEVVIIWLFKTEYIIRIPHLMRVNSPFIFLLAPSFYLLVVGKVSERKNFRLSDLVHFIPSIILFGFLIPFYFQSSQEKLALYYQWLQGIRVDKIPTSELYRLQQLAYVVLIMVVLIPKPKKIDSFVLIMVFAYLTIWAMDLYRYFFQGSSYLMISSYLISFIPVMIFFELNAKKKRNDKKYATSGLDASRSNQIANDALDLIRGDKLYKDPKLKLSYVAELMGMHHNYISQAINETFYTSFRDLINSMRIDEAKKLLSEKSNNHLTLEAIAELSGFNSVSSFNSLFKKNIGETPSSFKKAAQLD